MQEDTIETLIENMRRLEARALGDVAPNRNSRQQLVNRELPPPDSAIAREFDQLIEHLIQIYIRLDTLLTSKLSALKRRIDTLTAKNAEDPEIMKHVTERDQLRDLLTSLPAPPPGYE